MKHPTLNGLGLVWKETQKKLWRNWTPAPGTGDWVFLWVRVRLTGGQQEILNDLE